MPDITSNTQPPADIALISFDGDGTLWDFDAVMRRALRAVLDALKTIDRRAPAQALDIGDLIALRERVARAHQGRGVALEEIRLLSFVALVEQLAIQDAGVSNRLNDVFFAERFGTILPYDETIETLTTLQKRTCIGLLTNGNTDPQRHELGHLFDFTMFAVKVGYAKPDPRLFEAMLKQQGCEPSQAIHVGDSLVNDVAAAQQAGLYAIWLDRSGAGNATDILPDSVINNLAALPGILE